MRNQGSTIQITATLVGWSLHAPAYYPLRGEVYVEVIVGGWPLGFYNRRNPSIPVVEELRPYVLGRMCHRGSISQNRRPQPHGEANSSVPRSAKVLYHFWGLSLFGLDSYHAISIFLNLK